MYVLAHFQGTGNKELISYIQSVDTEPLRKRKRSDIPPRLNDASSARQYIKRFLELEDDENTNLANALNLATIAQVDGSNKYIVSEADYIRKAIADEEAIQNLKSSLGSDEEEEEPELIRKREDPTIDEEEEEQEEDDIIKKMLEAKIRSYLMQNVLDRGENSVDEDSGKWFNEPVAVNQEGISQEG